MTEGTAPLVVGASIAGAVAALGLARAGIPTTVIERRRQPFAKVCGEGLHPPGRRLLESLLGDLTDLGSPLHGFRLSDRRGDLLAMDHPVGAVGLGCDRLALEHRLWSALDAAEGIDFRRGVALSGLARAGEGWAVETSLGPLAASHLVGADGIRSQVRALSGRERGVPRGRWGVRLRTRRCAAAPERVSIAFLPDCQVFLTPLGSGLVSVALLGDEARVRSLSEPGAWSACLAGSHPELAAEAQDGWPAGRPSILPHCGRTATRWCADRLYLVGDAAVFLDPISGAGMTLAALTGEAAAEAIAAAWTGRCTDRDAEHQAGRRMGTAVRPFRRLTWVLSTLARKPRLRTLAAGMLERSPALLRALTRPTAG